MATKKRGLGRNLNALLGNTQQTGQAIVSNEAPGELSTNDTERRDLPVDLIQRGKYQPRRDMHPEALEELAESIKAQGVIS